MHRPIHPPKHATRFRRACPERGQTTAEYALVLLAAGTIAMLVIAWAQDNNAVGALFNSVLSKITSLVA